jgi:hypothetical protein
MGDTVAVEVDPSQDFLIITSLRDKGIGLGIFDSEIKTIQPLYFWSRGFFLFP